MSRTTDAASLRAVLAQRTADADPALIEDLGEGALRCLACGHRCKVGDGKRGICQVRFNEGGRLRVPWGYVAGLQLDPIEKKPFFHAFPGEGALSFGMMGCDLHCAYCQNWVTSQALRDDEAVSSVRAVTPRQVVDLAQHHGSRVLVSTYNEPLITSEWAAAVFREGKARGMTCAYVSNGNGTPEVLDYLRPLVDLYKVDLKGFDDRRYRQLGGVLANVLRTIEQLKARGFWIEVVTLVIPGFNDGETELRGIAEFLAGIGREIPWHVTAFHPDYKMGDTQATSAQTLLRAYELGKAAGLWFVYPGNLPGRVGDGESTFCPRCNALLIARLGFRVMSNRVQGGRCPDCAFEVPGVWSRRPEA
jgi:pyruvate formate lyase activating enzyme